MLKFLRKKNIAKKIFLVLAVIIIPAFIFWGVGPGIREKDSSKYIGKIFGKKIDINEYKKAYRTVFIQASLRFGEEFRKIEPFLNLSQQAWDRLILLSECKKRRVKIKNSQIIDFVQEMPLFQKNGKFDDKIYEHILRYLRITPREFEEQIRDTLKIEKLFSKITENIKLDNKEAFKIYEEKNDKVKVDCISFLIKDFKPKVKFEEKELREFYEKNLSSFFIPLAINLEYIFITPDKTQNLERLLASNKKDLKKISKTLNQELTESGLFDIQNPPLNLDISKEILEKFSSLKLGQIQAIQTNQGIYLISLKEKREQYLLDFSKVKDEVKEIFINLKAKELAKAAADNTFSNFKKYIIKKEADFLKAAKSNNASAIKLDAFTREDYIPDIGINKNFTDAAFSLPLKSFSEVIETPSGFFIIFKNDFIFADKKTFESQKEKLTEEYLTEKKQKAFDEFFKGLKNHTQLYILPK